MQPFIADLERLVEQNDSFRQVVFTAPHSQLVAMLLAPGEDIGIETHDVDQLFLVIEGIAEAEVGGDLYELEEDGLLVVPAGTRHNILNVGDDELRLLTVYSPPEHAPGTIHRTKADAMNAEHLVPA